MGKVKTTNIQEGFRTIVHEWESMEDALAYIKASNQNAEFRIEQVKEPTLRQVIAEAPIGTLWHEPDGHLRVKVNDERYIRLDDVADDLKTHTYPIGWLNDAQTISEYTVTEPVK